MALSCDIKEQIFTFQGKDYNYNEFRFMMLAGLMDAVESDKAFLVTGEGDAKNVVDVLDAEALDAFLQEASGNNALGISKARIISQAIRAMNSLVASGKGYNEDTGKGVRIFISKTHADHQAAQMAAEGRKQDNRGFIIPRVDKKGNKQGYDIYINLEAASAATVAHEVMHFYLTEQFGEKSPLFRRFVESMNSLLKGSDVEYLTSFANNYASKGEEMMSEEYLVEMGGMLASRMASGNVTPKEQTLFEKIADLFNEFLYKLTKGKLGYTIDVSSKTAVQEFFESLAGAVADGKAFNQQLAEAAQKEVEQSATDSSQEGVSQEEAPSSKQSKIQKDLTTFAADEKARAAQEAKEDTGRGVPSRSLSVDPATRGEDFYKAIREASRRHKLGRAVDVKDKEFYTSPGTKLFLAEDETAGVAVTDYGDLVSVFKAPGSSANINELLAEAAEESMTLDAFDINGFLPDLYAKHGFVPVARVPFNEQYAPEGWPYELAGKPDVVLMVRDTEGVLGVSKDPYSSVRDSVPSFENYDDAVAEQKKAVDKVYQKDTIAEGPVRPEAMEGKLQIIEDISINTIGLSGQVAKGVKMSKQSLISGEVKRFPSAKNIKSEYKVPLSRFAGKNFNVHESDRMTGGYIEDDQNNVLYRFFGGVYYPHITGKWWASRKLSTAQAIARNANKGRDKDGYVYSAPMVGSPGQHMSNEDMLFVTVQLMRQDALAKDASITKAELIEFIEKAFNRKKLISKKPILQRVLNKNQTTSSIFNELEFYLFQKGEFFVDKSGNEIVNESGNKIKNFSFEERLTIVEGILGDPKIKNAKFPSAGTITQAAARFEEPITRQAQDIGDLVVVYRTKGDLRARQTSASDPMYHRSYPYEIYAVNKDGSTAEIEIFFLDGAYPLREAMPVLTKAKGGQFNYEEYSKKQKYYKKKGWATRSEKESVAQYARTAKLSYASGRVSEAAVMQPAKAKESKISQFVSAPTGTQAMPSSTLGITPEITAKESKIIKVFDDTGFISVQSMVESLINDREYLNSVIASILEAREILKKGKVRPEATAAAYLITIGSIGSMGMSYENWSAGGKTMSKVFLEKKEGRDWVRPEGAAAAYLYTDVGKKLIEDFIGGTATKEQITDMFLFIGMGRENIKTRDVFNTMQSGGIKKMTDLLNTNKGEDFDALYEGAKKFLSGIDVGKTGFFNQYFGVSGRAVLDAREWNAWVAGQMKLTKEQMERRKKYEVSPQIQQMLLERIEEVGLALGYSKDLAGYIAHHAIWDAVADTITEHAGEYAVIKEYQKPKAKRKAKLSVIGEILPPTIEIDGKTYPTTASDGRQIHSTRQGVINHRKWFGKSTTVDKEGRPLVFFHGTARVFDEFTPKQANAIFVTQERSFAEDFAVMSADWMARHPFLFFDQEKLKELYQNARVAAKKALAERLEKNKVDNAESKKKKELSSKYKDWRTEASKEELDEYYKIVEKQASMQEIEKKTDNWDILDRESYKYVIESIDAAEIQSLDGKKTNDLPRVFADTVLESMPSKPVVLELYVKAERPFDYEVKEDIERLSEEYSKLFNGKKLDTKDIEDGYWPTIESENVQKAIRSAGFDSFYVEEGGDKNLAVYNSSQIKSASENNGAFGINIPQFREQKIFSIEDAISSANEETREFITVVDRRLKKLGFDGRDADAQVLRDRGLFKDPEEFEMARKAAGDLFAQTLYDPAISSLPPLDIAKALVDKIDTIENLPSKIYFSGNVHAFIDDMVMSKKIGKRLRENLRSLSDDVVTQMALKGREYGQASAMFARVYADFKKFDFLVQKKKFEQDMEAKFNSTQLEEGKNLKDAVGEVRSDVEELLSQSPELSELVELAGEVNDTYMSDHADAVAQGDISGLKDPKTVTAEEFIEQKNKFEEVIRDLENKIKGLQDKLADVTKLYSNEKTKNARQASEITDLRNQISKLNALIDKLRDSNKKISANASYYKQELQKLRDKFKDLKSLLAILRANKYISKQRQDKMMQALLDMIAGGRLDDPDFDSVFGEVFQISVVSSKDKAALESLANGLKYLADNPHSEISQAYIKRFNDYLESVSTEAWDSYRFASLLHSMFYTSVLSGWSTVFNATFGSIFTAVPNAAMYSFVNIILNPKTAIGSIFYGMRRMAMETPAAASKGVFAQRAYDNLGTSWSGENLTENADLAEVHLVKGFARNLDRLKKGDIKSMPKNLVAVLGSIVYPLTVIKRLMMFIDPTVTHMLSSYVQGSMEYKRAVDELKTIKSSAPKDMLDVLTYWSPFLNLRHLRKIDEHVNYAKKDRKAAADQALAEIDVLKDKGIKIERDYARRRTSEILREKIGNERALMFDKIARDWLMMWRPDGIIGAAWDYSAKGLALKRDNEKNGGAFMNYSKTAISMLFFTFLRITGAGINIAQAATPIVGLPLAIFGVRKNHQEGRGVMGQWGWGYKYKTSKEGVLAPLNPISIYKDLRDAEDFESKRTVSRIGISLFSHMVMFAVLSNMFDMADEDDEDETGYVDIPLLGKFKLSEDRAIDITSSGTGASPKRQESQEGRVSFAVRFNWSKILPDTVSKWFKVEDEWGRWMSYKLAPHVLAPFALIGRAADDAKGIYYNPKGMADTARPAEGIMEYGAEIPLAIGEWSFNALGRLWSSSRYDASGAFTKFMLNPFYAIAQPRAASDIITMSEDMLDLPKKNLYEGEGARDALMNLNYSIYGVGRLFAPDATDQFGLPVKTINPITNWWTYASDESLRSKESPEWNLAYRYQNTNMPSNMSFKIERVDATTGSGHLLGPEQKKYLSDYEKYVSLSDDEQTLVTNLVKAEFRKRMLDVYETLPAEAAEYSSSDYIDPGEYVTEEINKILKESKEYVKNDVILMVNASDRKEKQKYMDNIFKYTDRVNRESNEISRNIISSGPLPKTGLGRDVKRRVKVKKITL